MIFTLRLDTYQSSEEDSRLRPHMTSATACLQLGYVDMLFLFFCFLITTTTACQPGHILWQCDVFPVFNPLGGCVWYIDGVLRDPDNLKSVPDPTGRPGNVMQIFYRNQSLIANKNNKGGIRFLAHPFPPNDALKLQYDVYFSENFHFVLGGKLPGFYGGKGQCSGGIHHQTCFSTRFMWREHGAGEVYAYIPNEDKDWFCDKPLVHCNAEYGNSFGRGSWKFMPGHWYTIGQKVMLNTPGKENGVITISVNGKEVYGISGLKFRVDDSIMIDALIFNTFFGGNEPEWASTRDVYTYFRNFKVTC